MHFFSSYFQVFNQNTEGFSTHNFSTWLGSYQQMLLKGTKDLPAKKAAPSFGEDATWEELLLSGQTVTPSEQMHSLCGSYCTFITVSFVLLYYRILLSILMPLVSTWTSKEMDGVYHLQNETVFFLHFQFSANLIYLVFCCLTRLNDVILLNKQGSCTA